MKVEPDDVGTPRPVVGPRQYACFISYSTARDYKLARQIHRFLSGFPAESAISRFHVETRKFCMDGATFRLPRQPLSPVPVNNPNILPEAIREVIRPHLLESDSLLLLCAGDGLTPAMKWEVREFLAQNRDSGLDRPLWLAVTQGRDPAAAPAQFFGDELTSVHLISNIYFDFRGFHPKSAAWDKVRNFEEEELRLAAELFDVRDDFQRALSADDLSPAWQREKLARLRRTRALAVGIALVMSVLTSFAVWQAVRAATQKKIAEIARQAEEDARHTADEKGEEERRAFSQSDFLQAIRLIKEDNAHLSLAYLARAIRTNPNNSAAVARLYSLLVQRSWPLPLTPPLRHDGAVHSAQFSYDGTRVVTASDDHTARIWNSASGIAVTPPLQHDAGVNAAEFSPDGQKIVTASDQTVRVWDALSGRLISFVQFGQYVHSTHFSPDGKFLLTACKKPAAILTDVTTGNYLELFSTHGDGVGSAVFSPNGQLVATLPFKNQENNALGMSKVEIFENNWSMPKTTLGDNDFAHSVQFFPDGWRVLITTNNYTLKSFQARAAAGVWDAINGKQLLEIKDENSIIDRALLSRDGNFIITISYQSKGNARVWNANTGQPIADPLPFESGVVTAELNATDRCLLIATESDDAVHLWNPWTNKRLSESMKHDDRIYSAHFSPSDSSVLTVSADCTARLWEARYGAALPLMVHVGEGVCSARFSPDGKLILTASKDHTARLWDANSGQQFGEPLKHDNEVRSAEFDADGRRIVTASKDKSARLWDVATGKALFAPLLHTEDVTTAYFSADKRLIFTNARGERPKVWDSRSGKLLYSSYGPSFYILSAELSPDGSCVATVSGDRTSEKAMEGDVIVADWDELTHNPSKHYDSVKNIAVRVWDTVSGSILSEFPRKGGIPGRLSFSPDGRWLVAACDDDVARMWQTFDARTPVQLLRHRAGPNAGYMCSASFSPDGRRVLTASQDYSARVWDATTGQPLTEPLQHDNPLQHGEFGLNGSRVVTASDDGTARIWDTESGQLLIDPVPSYSPDRSGNCVQLSPDGCRLLTSPKDGVVVIWDVLPPATSLPPDWLPDLAEVICGYTISDNGVFRPEDPTLLFKLKARLKTLHGNDFWNSFGRWVFADRSTRANSPWPCISSPKPLSSPGLPSMKGNVSTQHSD